MPRINIAPVKTYKSSSRASLAHLFTTNNNDTSFDQLKKNTDWKVTYKNGMFITIVTIRPPMRPSEVLTRSSISLYYTHWGIRSQEKILWSNTSYQQEKLFLS